ncbi:MAG: hypothetical protein J0I20_08915 [Chloroflexi bacterium]|nr:hypothetical protein [Chloroflexota bacterium]OJV97025.1 MAG: hypothetical protein BGO39_18625 [Chloroflexi bacterium 54-19]
MKKLAGLFSTTPTGLQTYEIYYATSAILPKIADLLLEKFGFEMVNFLDGIDVYYLDCARPDCELSIAWDIWLGLHIFSFSEPPGWEVNLHKIGEFLDTQLENLIEFMDQDLLARELEEKE